MELINLIALTVSGETVADQALGYLDELGMARSVVPETVLGMPFGDETSSMPACDVTSRADIIVWWTAHPGGRAPRFTSKLATRSLTVALVACPQAWALAVPTVMRPWASIVRWDGRKRLPCCSHPQALAG